LSGFVLRKAVDWFTSVISGKYYFVVRQIGAQDMAELKSKSKKGKK